MPVWFLKIVQLTCLITSAVLILLVNIVNYYFVDNKALQWDLAINAIAWIMFLTMVYVWINESIKKNIINTIISGWSALYLSINLGVVLLGYNLYTRGVIEMFIITTLAGLAHLGVRIWQKY